MEPYCPLTMLKASMTMKRTWRPNVQTFFCKLLVAITLFGVGTSSAYSENISGFKFRKSLPANFKAHGMQTVRKTDGHPVRSGKTSIRFEVRPGDCSWVKGWNDCKNDRERHELISNKIRGEKWIQWSLYMPEDFPIIWPAQTAMAQFHQAGDRPPAFMFQNRAGGYTANRQKNHIDVENRKLLNDEDMRGKWSDILVHVKWTSKADGFFRVYVNGEVKPRYVYQGATHDPGAQVVFKFGIYRSWISRTPNVDPTQVLYYDDVRLSSKCRNAATHFDCDAILANLNRVLSEFDDKKKILDRAKASEGEVLTGQKAKAAAACKDPTFAAIFPDKCGT